MKEKGPEEILKDFGKQEIETAISTGLSEIKSSGIEFVCQDNERYPKKLFDLECPPAALFVFGTLPESQDLVAMVGTRKASPHGIGIARNMAFEFSKTGIVVVSGMADG
ncbi:MAG: DNA-protecting protein DprA, partial [Caldisericales bacterium]|nr:DNA-protecting protein DprA [Caldisericales bacterium]